MAYETFLGRILSRRGLRILMSDSCEWGDATKDALKRGLGRTGHKLEFGSISPQSFTQYDLVVPWVLSDYPLYRQCPEILHHSPIPIPSQETVSLCDDKYRFGQALVDRGFGSYIPSMESRLKLPYMIKARIGSWGKDCYMIHQPLDEQRALNQLGGKAFFRQEVISGSREFATHILFANGRIVKSLNVMYEFDTEYPIKGQHSWRHQVIHRCPYLALFGRVLKSIGYQGLCCVNYKVARGKPYILEINPRFGGSLAPFLFSFIRHLNIQSGGVQSVSHTRRDTVDLVSSRMPLH